MNSKPAVKPVLSFLQQVAALTTFFVIGLNGYTAVAAPACADLFSSAAAAPFFALNLNDIETKFGFDIHEDFMRLTKDDTVVEIGGGVGAFALQASQMRGSRAVVVNDFEMTDLMASVSSLVDDLGSSLVHTRYEWKGDNVRSSVIDIAGVPRSTIARLAASLRITAPGAIVTQTVAARVDESSIAKFSVRVLKAYNEVVQSQKLSLTTRWPRGTATLLIDSGDRLALSPNPLKTFARFNASLRIGGRAHFDLSKASLVTLTTFRRLAKTQPNAYRLDGKHLIYVRLENT